MLVEICINFFSSGVATASASPYTFLELLILSWELSPEVNRFVKKVLILSVNDWFSETFLYFSPIKLARRILHTIFDRGFFFRKNKSFMFFLTVSRLEMEIALPAAVKKLFAYFFWKTEYSFEMKSSNCI